MTLKPEDFAWMDALSKRLILERRALRNEADRKERKLTKKIAQRMENKIQNHIHCCETCQEGSPCKTVLNYAIFWAGRNQHFGKMFLWWAEERVNRIIKEMVTPKKKLDLIH